MGFGAAKTDQQMSLILMDITSFLPRSMWQSEATFTLIRVRVPSAGFSLRLVQASPVRVSVHGQLYKDNSTRVYRQSPEKSNPENALRKSNNIPLNR